MFNLSEIPESFAWEIEIKMPYVSKQKANKGKGGNSFRSLRCHVEMALLDDEETNRLLGVAQDDDDELDHDQLDEQLDEQAKNADGKDPTLVERILIGFGDDVMQNVDGKAVPLKFNAKNKAAFLNTSLVRLAVIRGYMEAMTGQQAQRKN